MNRKTLQYPDCSTRRKRKSALAYSICILERISLDEAAYMDNMPANLQCSDAYDTSEYYVSLLEEAIDVLRSVYNN